LQRHGQRKGEVKHTKAQELASQYVKERNREPEQKQEFKLKRFKEVEPRTTTNRPQQKKHE